MAEFRSLSKKKSSEGRKRSAKAPTQRELRAEKLRAHVEGLADSAVGAVGSLGFAKGAAAKIGSALAARKAASKAARFAKTADIKARKTKAKILKKRSGEAKKISGMSLSKLNRQTPTSTQKSIARNKTKTKR